MCRYYSRDSARRLFEEAGFREVSVRYCLTSRFAARLFAEAIRGDFKYRFLEASWLALRLRLAELFSGREDEGIYLLVRARK